MLNLGVVQQDATIYIPFATRDASGGAVGFSATIEVADFDIYKDGSATQRSSTAGFTIAETFDTVTGLHMLSIDLSDDTDAGFYAAGSTFHVALTPDETVDSQTIAEWIGAFTIESASDKATRRLRELMYPNNEVATTTGNTTTAINLTEVVDSSATADDLINEVLAVGYVGGTYDGLVQLVVVTDYAVTNQLATVEKLGDGTALDEAVAANDFVWRIDHAYANTKKINDADVIGAGTSGDKWRGA